jgi:hypothetical protein
MFYGSLSLGRHVSLPFVLVVVVAETVTVPDQDKFQLSIIALPTHRKKGAKKPPLASVSATADIGFERTTRRSSERWTRKVNEGLPLTEVAANSTSGAKLGQAVTRYLAGYPGGRTMPMRYFLAILTLAISMSSAGVSPGHAGPHGCYRSQGCH